VPATPFHLPASAVAGWPLRRHLDLPAFLLANLAVDIEPVVALLLDLDPPPHGLAHTFLGASVIGAVAGWLLWRTKGLLESLFRDAYPLRARTAVVSGAAGGCLHVAIDAVMYGYLRPFFPLEGNPLHWPGSGGVLQLLGALLLVPALLLVVRDRHWRSVPEKLTVGLLGLSAVTMGLYAAVML
jgi:membrane-bound metal-dependent hydrolase YbcI (DUF457 family)